MNLSSALKRIEAAQRRQGRAALQQQRELDRRLKELAKLSEIERARLEVEAYENQVDVLLSVHKESCPPVDWMKLFTSLPPHPSSRMTLGEQAEAHQEWQKLRDVAGRVLAGDTAAYGEALRDMSSIAELSTLGSSVSFQVTGAGTIECDLHVNGREVIPAQVKSLASSGKLAVKVMARARFHELYQDHVCGSVLRVGREVFALLPVHTVIVTARVTVTQGCTGDPLEIPVISVILSRQVMERLNFELLDPSDSMENFSCRGDVKTSRKSGEFMPVNPFMSGDVPGCGQAGSKLHELMMLVALRRDEIRRQLRQPALSS